MPPNETQRMVDSGLIRQVAEQYAFAVDSLDAARLEACFTEEILADYSEISGQPAARAPRGAFAQAIVASMSGFDSTQHLIANVAVDFGDADDRAMCEVYVQATHVVDDKLWVVGGRYLHHVVLTHDGWRIETLKLASMWQSGEAEIRELATARGRAGEGKRKVR